MSVTKSAISNRFPGLLQTTSFTVRYLAHYLFINTACKRSLRRLCFHSCLSVHRGDLPHCMLGYTPQADPPGQSPLGLTHPPAQTPPWADTPPAQCMQQVGSTHPTGMHSCFTIFHNSIPKNFLASHLIY